MLHYTILGIFGDISSKVKMHLKIQQIKRFLKITRKILYYLYMTILFLKYCPIYLYHSSLLRGRINEDRKRTSLVIEGKRIGKTWG